MSEAEAKTIEKQRSWLIAAYAASVSPVVITLAAILFVPVY